MASAHKALNLVEDLLKAYIVGKASSDLSGVTICRGFEIIDRTAISKRIEITAQSAEPEMVGDTCTGNVVVRATVAAVAHYNDMTRANIATICGALWDMFEQSQLATDLNAVTFSGLSVYGGGPGAGEGVVLESINRSVDGPEFREELTLTLYVSLHD